jgi:hypothetical protein
MHFRTLLALGTASLVIASVMDPAPARAADSTKEVCLSSADLGQSLRDDGKFSLARDQFATCARDVCPKLVHDQCAEWLHQLDESMPTVVFHAKDDHGADVTTARVLEDGKLVAATIDGKPMPVDPGSHDFRFERDDPRQATTVHAGLRAGEKNRDVTAAFAAVEGAAPSSPEGLGGPASPAAPETPASSSTFWSGRNVTSLALLVGGATGVGLGVVFGLQSQNDKSEAATLRTTVGTTGCPMPSVSPTCQQLSNKVDAQNSAALISDVLYVAGGVLAAGALTTWLLWPKSADEPHAGTAWVAPILGPTSAGVGAGGSF